MEHDKNGMLVLRARQNPLWVAAKIIVPLTLVAGIGVAYHLGLLGGSKQTAATEASGPSGPINPAMNTADEIPHENDVLAVARAAGGPPPTQATPTPTPVATTPASKDIPPPPPENAQAETKPPDGNGIMGQAIAMGLIAVEVENYWVDDDKKTMAYAVLTGSFQNVSAQQTTLPTVDVALLDNDKRLYKPSKQVQPGGAKLNPLMKSKNTWFFELPPNTPMYCVQFSAKQGKNQTVAYVKLGERTPENLQLMNNEDYQNEFLELMIQASPRIKAQGEYAKAKAVLDGIGDEMDDLKGQAVKLDKKLKVANDAVDIAKMAVDKAKKDSEATKAWMKDIDSNPAKFGHNQRLQDIEYSKAQTQAARNAKSEQTTNDALKDKTAAKKKLDDEMKDLQTKLKALGTKYEAQEKIADKLKEKIEP